MASKKATASYQVIDLVRDNIKTEHWPRPSDAAVARALDIKPGTVGGYKSGREFMSAATLERAQQIMELAPRQLAELYIAISMEASKDRGAEKIWLALREAVRGKAAGVVGAVLATAMMAHPEPAQARTECPVEVQPNQSLTAGTWYIMRSTGIRAK